MSLGKPIPLSEVDNHANFNCPRYSSCLDKMAKISAHQGWTCRHCKHFGDKYEPVREELYDKDAWGYGWI